MSAQPDLATAMARRYGWIAPPRPYTGPLASLRWMAFTVAIRADLAIKRGLGW